MILNEHRDRSEEDWSTRPLEEKMSRNQGARVVEGSLT